MGAIQNGRSETINSVEAIHDALRLQNLERETSTHVIVKAVEANKVEVDLSPLLTAMNRNVEASTNIIARVNAVSGENQVNLGRVLEAVDFGPLTALFQQSKDPIIDEVRKLKQNFSVKIDLSPILTAIAEIHEQLTESLKLNKK